MEIRPPPRPTELPAPPDELLAYAADRLGGFVFQLDAETRILFPAGRAHGAVVACRGRTRGRLMRRVYADVPEILAALDRALAGEPASVRAETDGTVYDWDFAPIRDPSTGAVVCILGSAVVVREVPLPETLGLPARQAEVVHRLAAGQTIGGIARVMFLSGRTVSEYARRVRKTLKLETTNELIAHGARLGWGERYRRLPGRSDDDA